MALVKTVGADNANSFVDISDANAYMDTRLHDDAWSAASDPDKEAALIWAGRLINTTIRWNGTKVTATQGMSWPRSGLVDESGYAVPEDEIPDQIKYLQMEEALLLLQSDRTAESQAGAQGLTSLRAGSVTLSFKDDIVVKQIPDPLMAMIPVEWLWRVAPYPLVVN